MLVASGCGLHAGSTVMIPASGAPVAYGVGSGWSFYPSGGSGFSLGGRGRIGFTPKAGELIRAWGGPTAGYGKRPLPATPSFGMELNAGPLFGALRDSGSYAGAIGWGMELDLLYRLSGPERPWEVATHDTIFHMIVPSIQFAQLIPIGSGHKHTPDTTFVFSLSYRFDNWLAVEP